MSISKEEIDAFAKEFELEEARFYALVGRTIDQWVWVEHAIHDIFQFTLASPHDTRVAAVFYSQINFRAKLDMTDAALKTFLQEPLLDEWDRLFKRLKKKAGKRSQIAHNHVSLEPGGRMPNTKISKLTHKIKPEANKPANRIAFLSGKDDIDYSKLRAILHEFLQIRVELERFLVTLKQPPPAFP